MPPVIVVEEDGLRVWHKLDDKFETPRATVNFMVTSDAVLDSARVGVRDVLRSVHSVLRSVQSVLRLVHSVLRSVHSVLRWVCSFSRWVHSVFRSTRRAISIDGLMLWIDALD